MSVDPSRQSGPSSDSGSGRILALDGLRGIAALGVVLFHVYPTYIFWCWSFVDLFFVLSGFLITRIVLTSSLPPATMLKHFWIRRALRIWPVYYCALIAALALGIGKQRWLALDFEMEGVLQAFTFTQLIQFHLMDYPLDHPFVPYFLHSWSIAVEEQFYLLWPLLLLGFRKRLQWMLPITLVLMASSFALRGSGVLRLLIGTRPDGLALGALVAIAYVHPELRRWKRWLPPALVCAVVTVSVYFWQGYVIHLGTPLFDPERAGYTFWVPAFAVLYASLVAYLLAEPDSVIARGLRAPLLVYFGSISYAMYMFHLPVAGLVRGAELAAHLAWAHDLLNLLTVALSIIAGHLSTTTMEAFFARWKHRYPMMDRPSRAIAEPLRAAL